MRVPRAWEVGGWGYIQQLIVKTSGEAGGGTAWLHLSAVKEKREIERERERGTERGVGVGEWGGVETVLSSVGVISQEARLVDRRA